MIAVKTPAISAGSEPDGGLFAGAAEQHVQRADQQRAGGDRLRHQVGRHEPAPRGGWAVV